MTGRRDRSRRLVLDGASPVSLDDLAAVADVLRAGQMVLVPTDTVYGLAALPAVPGATAAIFAAKGRAADVPLAVLVAAPADLDAVAADVPVTARRLAERFWPGPLTLVLRRRPDVVLELGEPSGTVGVRCPDHAFLRALAAEVGPVAATSANRHGEPTPRTANEVVAQLGAIAFVVDGGPCAGVASSVVDCTMDPLVVVRAGPIPAEELLAVAAGRS